MLDESRKTKLRIVWKVGTCKFDIRRRAEDNLNLDNVQSLINPSLFRAMRAVMISFSSGLKLPSRLLT